jgi:SagB-type dehydrogenase family enzyme
MLVRVSRRVVFYWRDDQLICDNPVRHRQLALTPAAERLLRTFAGWNTLDAAEDAGLAKQLYDAGVLVSQEDDSGSAWETMGQLTTAYHLSTRGHDETAFRTSAEALDLLRAKATDEPIPSPYKDYPGERLALPAGDLPAELERLLRARRSTRAFDLDRGPTAEQLGTVLRWIAGPLHEVDVQGLGSMLLKAVSSGGARHPLEVYPVVRRAGGVEPGIYHYSARHLALEPVRPGAVSDDEVLHWCGGQPWAADAAVLLLYTAVIERATWKYPTANTYRTMFLDAGHVSQTAYLVATALGLGAFFTVATRDAAIERDLGLSWTDEIFLGTTALGVLTEAERSRQADMLAGGPVHSSRPRHS